MIMCERLFTPENRSYHRILWRDISINQEPKVYEFNHGSVAGGGGIAASQFNIDFQVVS